MRVLIENSAGNPSTSMKHARNYVRRKRAEWVRNRSVPTIRFIESDRRHQHVVAKSLKPLAGAHYQARLDTLAEPYQLRGLPFIGNVWLMYA